MPALVWRPGIRRDGDCRLRKLHVDDSWKLLYGVSRAGDWPDDASVAMDPEVPKDVALSDSPSGAGVVIVSARVKKVLDELGLTQCELLPVSLINHRGRIASRDYFVVNPLRVCDCIDLQASGTEWNPVDKTALTGVTSLALDRGAIAAGFDIFRPRHWPMKILLRRDLADRLAGEGFSAMNFIEPASYTGLT
jgi:hypothetical protein